MLSYSYTFYGLIYLEGIHLIIITNNSLAIIVVLEIVIATIIQMTIFFIVSFSFHSLSIICSIKRIAIMIYMSMRAFFMNFT